MILSIISVIKPPAPGFEKTRDSVRREFGGCADVEYLIKEFSEKSISLSGSGSLSDKLEGCPRPDPDPDTDTDNDSLSERIIRKPDTGVFDGMNQAIAAARGEWILFLNAGDWLAEGIGTFLLEALEANPGADYFYCDGVTVDADDGREFRRVAPDQPVMADFLARAPILHPCLVVRTALLRERGFETRLDLAADFDLMVRLVANGRAGVKVPGIGAFVLSGGLSERYRIRARCQAMGSLLRNAPGVAFRVAVLWHFLKFLTLHLLIVYGIRPIGPLRRRAKARSGGRPAGTYGD